MGINTSQRIGILGGGQLGRLLVPAAHALNAAVHIFTPETNSPASQWADHTTVASFDDRDALATFAQSVDLVTLEFENIPVDTLEWLATQAPVYPNPRVLKLSQNRLLEKTAISALGIPVTPFVAVHSAEDLAQGVQQFGNSAMLKTATLGYDGKGQWRIDEPITDLDAFFADCQTKDTAGTGFVLEQRIAFTAECSVIVARNRTGHTIAMGPFGNTHTKGILDLTRYPAPDLSGTIQQQAIRAAEEIATALDVIGLLCVEFFITSNPEQPLLVNEIAPRPHNSGHITMDYPGFSQFDRHMQALLLDEFPINPVNQPSHGLMKNFLGDLWFAESALQPTEPDWDVIAAFKGVALHRYGKADAKPGRKMGHLSWVGNDPSEGDRVMAACYAALQTSVQQKALLTNATH